MVVSSEALKPIKSFQSFRNRLLIALLCVNVLLGIGLLGNHFVKQAQKRAQERKLLVESAQEYTRLGVLQGTEGTRWVDLLQSTKWSGGISDADLGWVISRMAEPEKRRSQSGLRADMMMEILGNVTSPSPTQKEQIFQESIRQFRLQDTDGIGLQQFTAMHQFRRMNDKRAIPFVLPYMQDKRPQMRRSAFLTLRKLGYTDFTPQQLAEAEKAKPRKLPRVSAAR